MNRNYPLSIIVSYNQVFFFLGMLIPGKHVPFILKEGNEKTLVASLAIGNDQIDQLEKEK